LNGQSQTIGGLNSVAGSNASATTNNYVGSTAAATLTISGPGSYAFSAGTAADSGLIGGAISLVKNGSGTQFLGQANIFTGKTTINGGAIACSGESRFGAAPGSFTADQITLNGGRDPRPGRQHQLRQHARHHLGRERRHLRLGR
jgi:fibronectin-binding autotransporter adhesin